jgi:hypothetical protein
LSATLQHPWLLAMAGIGAIAAFRQRRARVPLVFAAALALQTAGLWLVARMSGAATPYMALKMTYLAIYPAIAFAAVAAASAAAWLASRSPRTAPILSAAAWLAVAALAVGAGRDLRGLARVVPIVNDDLFSAARWTREHVPVGCVDYLVGNNYTAYWLHLAGLGNPRISARTADDDTFDSQASMGRWLVPSGIRYAIADTTLLPMEIRNDVDVLATFGRAEVIQRRGPSSCPGE